MRLLLRPVVTLLLIAVAAPVWAEDKNAVQKAEQRTEQKAEPRADQQTDRLAPSAAVAAAWAAEAGPRPPTSRTLKSLYGSYGALQAMDMVSTISARGAGAREVNPVLDNGYGQAIAVKAVLAAATLGTMRLVEKRSRKAALVTMIALNVATAAVVATNMRNSRQLSQR